MSRDCRHFSLLFPPSKSLSLPCAGCSSEHPAAAAFPFLLCMVFSPLSQNQRAWHLWGWASARHRMFGRLCRRHPSGEGWDSHAGHTFLSAPSIQGHISPLTLGAVSFSSFSSSFWGLNSGCQACVASDFFNSVSHLVGLAANRLSIFVIFV